MLIIPKKRRQRSESLYIFQFKDKEDFDLYVKGLESMLQNADINEDVKKLVSEPLGSITCRTDDKYADEDHALSGCLFADEMADFTLGLSLIAAIYFR